RSHGSRQCWRSYQERIRRRPSKISPAIVCLISEVRDIGMAEPVLENLNTHGTWIENPKTGRILIVDDQEANTSLLDRILADAGYEKTYATTDARAVLR